MTPVWVTNKTLDSTETTDPDQLSCSGPFHAHGQVSVDSGFHLEPSSALHLKRIPCEPGEIVGPPPIRLGSDRSNHLNDWPHHGPEVKIFQVASSLAVGESPCVSLLTFAQNLSAVGLPGLPEAGGYCTASEECLHKGLKGP